MSKTYGEGTEMTDELERLIARDSALCAAMADELEAYLKSSELFWEPDRRRFAGVELPKLTLGGLLLAMRRLETLRQRLSPDPSQTLARIGRELSFHRAQWRLRYQNKLARDLRSRLDTWAWYLEDCQQHRETAIVHYPRQVETRAKIDLLLDEALEAGLDSEPFRERLVNLDERLRSVFGPGEFCWMEPLTGGFPSERFWYLYGQLEEV